MNDRMTAGEALETPPGVASSTLLEFARTGCVVVDGHRLEHDCPEPGPVHEHVGHLREGMGLRTRTALAAAGRSRGLETPVDDDLAAARHSLATLSSQPANPTTVRRDLADARQDTARLRETVANIRGELMARREAGLPTASTADSLEDAIRRLAEVETRRTAAAEALEREREATRTRRNDHLERFRLEERVANLERSARAQLVAQLEGPFATAVERVPGTPTPSNPFDAAPLTAALAIARLADVSAPLVLECEIFASAEAASEWLGAPVIHV